MQDPLTAQVGGSLSLFDRFAVFAGMPVNLVMAGDSIMGVPDADGAGIGDPYLGGRVRCLALAKTCSGSARSCSSQS